ncbi:MAG: NAD(P)H-dependent oxidoreductase [Pseudomonadota bacterium]
MRALVVHCHPSPDSFTAAVRDVVVSRLAAGGAEVEVLDLYAEKFDPVLCRDGWGAYEQVPANRAAVEAHAAAVRRAETLVFVYPTWWYGPPAMLKGWLERVLLPGVAFSNPAEGPIRPGLTHVRRLGVFTTCGASRWLTWIVGAPGRRTLLRGLRLNCHARCRTAYAAHYSMDSSTAESRARHLRLAAATADRLLRAPRRRAEVSAGAEEAGPAGAAA